MSQEKIYRGNWIWNESAEKKNAYVNFVRDFNVDGVSETAKLYICADTEYAVWINDSFVSCGQWRDYPEYLRYDTLEIAPFLKNGENRIFVKVYYQGEASMQYTVGRAGLWFRLENGEKAVSSDENTLTSLAEEYAGGEMFKTTMQLGYGFLYHARKDVDEKKMSQSQVLGEVTLYPRPIKKLVLSDDYERKVIAQGYLKREQEEETVAKTMQHDFLSSRFFEEVFEGEKMLPGKISAKSSSDLYFVIDLGDERGGYLSFDIDTSENAFLDIAYGEHLKDLRVRSHVGGRNFANRCICKEGRTQFTYYFRRIAGRYIQVHVSGFRHLTIYDMGIIRADYPVKHTGKFLCGDSIHEKIHDVCKNTLLCCMHEHYEDSPWREQGLYASDSRNQMLCGYYVFSEFDMPKSSHELIARSMRKNGYVNTCAPCGIDLYLPSFSFIWFVALREYLDYSNDLETLEKLWPQLEFMLDEFTKSIKNGIAVPPNDDKSWNFYEWTEGSRRGKPFHPMENLNPEDGFYDGLYHAFLCLALQNGAEIAGKLKKAGKAAEYEETAEVLKKSIRAHFYDEEKKVYSSYVVEGVKTHYGELMQSLVLLCGAADEEQSRYLRSVLADENNDLVKIMLSYTIYKYDALLQERETYLPMVLKEIKERWGRMLFENSKTFWECDGGAEDFEYAGSLCHGWSALPLYIYYRYVLGITAEFMRGETEKAKCSDYFPKLYGEVQTLKGEKFSISIP